MWTIAEMIEKKLFVVGPHQSFLSGNQQVIDSHAKWVSVIGHRRLRRPTRTNDNRCFLLYYLGLCIFLGNVSPNLYLTQRYCDKVKVREIRVLHPGACSHTGYSWRGTTAAPSLRNSGAWGRSPRGCATTGTHVLDDQWIHDLKRIH